MTVRISVSLPDDLHASLLQLASIDHQTVASTVRALLLDSVPQMLILAEYINGNLRNPGVLAATDELESALARVTDAFGLPHINPPASNTGGNQRELRS